MLAARILGSGASTGRRAVSTADLAARIGMDPVEAVARTGIRQRYHVSGSQDVAALATEALQGALARAGLAPDDLRRLILVSSTGGDVRIPATANRVLGALGIGRVCDAFDVNNACTGFLTGLDLAARSVATGLGPVAVVAAERFSDCVGPDMPRSYLVMGDAAAAVIVGASDDGAGLEHGILRNAADFYRGIVMEHATPHAASRVEFREENREIATTAIGGIKAAVEQLLSEASLTLGDIDWVVPHQPNGRLLAAMIAALGVSQSRVMHVVDEIGSVGAASAPFGLDRLLRSGEVEPGHRLLLCAVGAGMSYGAMIYRVGASAP